MKRSMVLAVVATSLMVIPVGLFVGWRTAAIPRERPLVGVTAVVSPGPHVATWPATGTYYEPVAALPGVVSIFECYAE